MRQESIFPALPRSLAVVAIIYGMAALFVAARSSVVFLFWLALVPFASLAITYLLGDK